MKVEYDKKVDAMYATLKKGQVAKTIKLDENVIIDLNKSKRILGIEILSVKERNPEILKALVKRNKSA